MGFNQNFISYSATKVVDKLAAANTGFCVIGVEE